MKKVKSGRKTSGMSGKAVPKNVEEYLSSVPKDSRAAFQQLRTAIRSAVPPQSVEVISYRIPAFKHKKVLVWFGAFAHHCSLFPTGSVVEAFREELKGYSTSKGTIHFPNDKPIPTTLVQKIVKVRVAESEGTKKS
jgi:uncharacterized protein YdhG (YjbR/CyaY superfamily)